jgi:hypothetical protein
VRAFFCGLPASPRVMRGCERVGFVQHKVVMRKVIMIME